MLERKPASKHMIDRARRLRRGSTGPEKKLWDAIRGRRLAALKFRRQHPIEGYVVDFLCAEQRLIVELDGDSHDETAYDYDMERQRKLEALGYRFLRVSNDEVLQELEAVLSGILRACGVDESGNPLRED